eukprot:62547-Rhodomonas_salina.1
MRAVSVLQEPLVGAQELEPAQQAAEQGGSAAPSCSFWPKRTQHPSWRVSITPHKPETACLKSESRCFSSETLPVSLSHSTGRVRSQMTCGTC